MVGGIFIFILFVIFVSALCSGGSSSDTSTKRNNTVQKRNTNTYYDRYAYCECPSCGAPGYDGYCEECGYPDINQGWLGENY